MVPCLKAHERAKLDEGLGTISAAREHSALTKSSIKYLRIAEDIVPTAFAQITADKCYLGQYLDMSTVILQEVLHISQVKIW